MPDYKEKAQEIAARWRGPVGGVLYGDILTALREAHEAGRREEREGWQPIETAPKDGTPIWLGSEHGSMRVGLWEGGAQHENHGTVGGGWRDFYRIECDGQRDTLWPVVWWHPLPSPPAILSEQGDG
ncbi:MAG: hypothetical protein KF810_17085 [Rhizobiaceae bacterium]|nr:hypothetical protein [Rhizobiaceae bacterium]